MAALTLAMMRSGLRVTGLPVNGDLEDAQLVLGCLEALQVIESGERGLALTAVAAALAADSDARPRDLAASAIQRELLHQGAYLSPTIEAGMQPASAAE